MSKKNIDGQFGIPGLPGKKFSTRPTKIPYVNKIPYVDKGLEKVQKFIFDDECDQPVLLTYGNVPELTFLIMEQLFYFGILLTFLFEIYISLKLVMKTEKKMEFIKPISILIAYTVFFSIVSFIYIPIMNRNCKQDGFLGYKVNLLRVLHLLLLSIVYQKFFDYIKNKAKYMLAKKLEGGKKVMDQYLKGDQYEDLRENLKNNILGVNYKYYVCENGAPLDGLEDVLTTTAYSRVSDVCEGSKPSTVLEKYIGTFV